MTVSFKGDSRFPSFFGGLLQGLGVRNAPKIGDVIEVKPGELLRAPPQGMLWYSPSWAKNFYQLHDLVRRPVLEPGDVFGIHPKDPIPLPPSGTQLIKLKNAEAPEGVTAAVMYEVVVPPAVSAALGLPKPKPPALQAFDIGRQPVPGPDQRWQVAYVDGRDLRKVHGALVAA